MKVDAADHPKTRALKIMLACEEATCIGHLELLWRFTAKYAIQGDIGKHTDAVIADACRYVGSNSAEWFVGCLKRAGFVDESQELRLAIHGWHEHAPAWVSAALAKKGLTFLTEPQQLLSSVSDASKGVFMVQRDGSKTPLLSSPSLSSPNPLKKSAHALPPEFGLTKEREDYARSKGVNDPKREMEAFRAHHAAHGKLMKDWDAAWRTWCLNARKFAGKNEKSAAAPQAHEPAGAKQKRDDLWTAQHEQKRFKLDPQRLRETDEQFIARVNRESAGHLVQPAKKEAA